MKTELLSPAKDKETAFAAIDCGADAVYIGASAFGARQNASNSISDIQDVVNYAHKFWVRVYVTVNTILNDDELPQALNLIKELDNIGVDAVIIQDLGLLYCLIEENLGIAIHMSTQCDNRLPQKVKFFREIGVNRVVLARELSIEQIESIKKENHDLDLECFIHGALCVSYSGQCYLSSYVGGRSANRGECAQPCRKKYSVINGNGDVIAKDVHALCLKDFNASKHIKKMVNAGVFSYKIEGRLKDKGYVKNITAFYRQELDRYSEKVSSGKSVYSFTPNPEKSFNRGFTDYFLIERSECYNMTSPKSIGEYIGKVKKVNKDSIVISTDKEIYAQDGLCYYSDTGMEGFLVNKAEGNIVFPNQPIKVKAGQKIYRNFDNEFEKELQKRVKRQIGIHVKYDNGTVTLKDEDGISVNIHIDSVETAKNQDKMDETFLKQFSKTGESDFYIEDIEFLSALPFMPISSINELRRNAFDKLMKERLRVYKRETRKPLKLIDYIMDKTDYRANVHNSKAEEFYNKCGCDVSEWSMETKIPSRQIELMRTKHCIKYALNMCKSLHSIYLRDEKGVIFPLKFDCKNCEMVVLSPINHKC